MARSFKESLEFRKDVYLNFIIMDSTLLRSHSLLIKQMPDINCFPK